MANSDGYNQQVGKTSTDACPLTHTEERDGDSAGSTRAFRGAESASRNLRRKRLWRNNRGEELSPGSATLRPLQRATPFLPVSLSFIAQGGRPLSSVTSH